MQLNEYWAKTSPWQSVVTHGIVSGRLAQTLFTGYLSAGTRRFLQDALHLDGPGLEAFLGYLVSLHDIGKIEYGFQSKDPAAQRRMDADPDVRRPLRKKASVPRPCGLPKRTGTVPVSVRFWLEKGE